MTREVESLVKPYAVDLVREGGKVVELNIKAVAGGELDPDTITEALRTLLERYRREQMNVLRMRDRQRVMLSPNLIATKDAYHAGGGRVTEEYLARLAVAYSELVDTGVNITTTLARALGNEKRPMLPLPTVRTHIARARREGFLTETTQGKEEGEPTEKARQILADLSGPPS